MAGAISADLIKELIRLEHIEPGVALTSYYRSGNRPDGRAGGYNAFREVRLTQLSSDRCQVEIGNTIVSAAISVAFGTPSPAASDQGRLEFDVSSGSVGLLVQDGFKGKSEDQLLLEALLDSIFESSGAINLSKLCIEYGRLVHVISIKIAVISDDGNIDDAAVFAAMKLLSSLVIPSTSSSSSLAGSMSDVASKSNKPIEFVNHRVALATFSIINMSSGDSLKPSLHIVADPIKLEETSKYNSGKLQIGFIYGQGEIREVCFMKQESTTPLYRAVINEVVQKAKEAVNDVFVANDAWMNIEELLAICHVLRVNFKVPVPSHFNRKTPLEEVRAFIRRNKKV